MRRTRHYMVFVWILSVLASVAPVLAQGDKVIPQVPDGPSFRTKFDFTNLGPDTSTPITKVTVNFFHQDGSPWPIATNQGTNSQFTLHLGRLSTMRLETLGQTATDTSGYVIVRNLESTTYYPEDYQVAVTAFYEVRSGGNVVDTVSVAVAEPTVWFSFPAQIDNSQNLFTGLAVVNLAGKANTVTLDLWKAASDTSTDATDLGSSTISLTVGQQKAIFLYPSVFPGQPLFKGTVEAKSTGPVAVLALLQTPTGPGPQYATMVPTYKDALRRNTQMFLRQGLPLDADIPVSDYFGWQDDSTPWDVLYRTDNNSNTQRHLEAQNGATFASLGIMNYTDFDNLTIENLQGLTYNQTTIDMSDSSPNLASDYAFAIKTGLGHYVKVHVVYPIKTTDTSNAVTQDLALEIFVYK